MRRISGRKKEDRRLEMLDTDDESSDDLILTQMIAMTVLPLTMRMTLTKQRRFIEIDFPTSNSESGAGKWSCTGGADARPQPGHQGGAGEADRLRKEQEEESGGQRNGVSGHRSREEEIWRQDVTG